jgi:Flp pilus assembly protein TadG
MKNKKHEKGTVLTEFALVIPIIGMFLTGIVNFGLAANDYMVLTRLAREGMRYGAVSTSNMNTRVNESIDTYMALGAFKGIDRSSVNINVESPAGADTGFGNIRVSINATYKSPLGMSFNMRTYATGPIL